MQNMPGLSKHSVHFKYLVQICIFLCFESIKEMFPKYLSIYIMYGIPLTCYRLVNDVPHTCNGRGNSVNHHDVTYSEIFLSFQHFVWEAVMVFLTQRFSYLFSTLFVKPSWNLFSIFVLELHPSRLGPAFLFAHRSGCWLGEIF